jgi:hypothetical protein
MRKSIEYKWSDLAQRADVTADMVNRQQRAKGLNRSRGRTLRLATQRSNRRPVILTSGAIGPLRAMIR